MCVYAFIYVTGCSSMGAWVRMCICVYVTCVYVFFYVYVSVYMGAGGVGWGA
jgi:hypothetical protein